MKIFKLSIKSTMFFGLIINILFIFFSRQMFEVFFTDEKLIVEGVKYLTIIGFSQAFQSAEIIGASAFNGIGKTSEPTIIIILGTAIRLPLMKLLIPFFGLNAIWWVISGTTIFKGLFMIICFTMVWKKYKEYIIKCIVLNKSY